ncbi:MAG: transcription termination factor NusA [Candidatus Bipolaricaulota bacterium]|nr:transcription termination factor NusA [Candidatus Bipolaricaulota bacterium]MDW8126526.1 transcription termination factor NusA [Candidatus Bipolaricaulota bacterium]
MNIEFLEALEEMARERGIDREAAYEAMEKGIAAAYLAEFGGTEPPVVKIDRRSGDVYVNGQKFDLSKLGRIATRRAEEFFRREILRRRREALYEMYAARVGEIINGTVHRFEGRDVWINLGDLEAIMPADERIPNERYIPGNRIKAYLYKVEKTQGDPKVFLSRAHPAFLAKLLAIEVPEIEQGMMEIVKVVRVPGVRAKVLVRGLDPRIDPVGSCIGPGGSRVRAVSRELAGEKIDVIKFSEDVREVIKAALAPASVVEVELDEKGKKATVVVPEHEVSLAIGREGHNVSLAARLTGYDLTVRTPSGEESKR